MCAYNSFSSKTTDTAAQIYSTVATIVVKKFKRYHALKLVYNYCIGLAIAVNEKVPIKHRES
jgi:hypothetical protein